MSIIEDLMSVIIYPRSVVQNSNVREPSITSQQCRSYYNHVEAFVERCLAGGEIEG